MDLSNLYEALSDLRLALPSTLLATLLLRWLVKAFLGMMDRIQSQGWEEEEGLFGAEPEAATTTKKLNSNGEGQEGEDEVIPVVVKSKTMRKGLVLGSMGMVAMTYLADGVAQGTFRLLARLRPSS